MRGFTLIEIMVVVVILGILGALIVPNIMRSPDEARITVARTDILAISNALNMYKLDNFVYPDTNLGLEALVSKPVNAVNWRQGGYLSKLPMDPWGNVYQYLSPGAGGRDFDLYSFGADGIQGGEGTGLDINSWEL
jgi:general secretion pathway protein G